MRFVLLDSAADDLEWFRHYYDVVFPAGQSNAKDRFSATINVLMANPYIGTVSEDLDGVRELSIPKTPFRMIYRVADTRIEIIRLRDERSNL